MSILSKLFGRPIKLPSVIHPVFGLMDATIDLGNGVFYWETPEDLVTPKGTIGIFCDAPESGPIVAQVDLWHFIYDNIEFFRTSAEPLLRDCLSGFQLEHRYAELAWISASLSHDGHHSSPWDISFAWPSGPILTACFEHGEPTTVTFDD